MAAKPAEGIRVEVSRDLGLLDVTRLGVGGMVGAGIFVLLAPATQVAGLSMLLALALTVLVVLLSAASYAELASVFPSAGGGYIWASESLPRPSGFLTGWVAWAGHSSALALSAMSLSAFAIFGIGAVLEVAKVTTVSGLLSDGSFWVILKTGALLVIIALVSSAGLRGRTREGRVPWVLMVKLVLIAAFLIAVFAAALLNPPATSPSIGIFGTAGWAGIPLAIGFIFVAFEGYEIIALSAMEVKNPQRTIPRGILISVGLVVLLYILLEISMLSLARYNCTRTLEECALAGPRGELSLAVLSFNNLGVGGAILLAAAGLAAMVTAVSNNLSSATRLSFTMAKEGTLSRRLADTANGWRGPSRPLLVSALLSSLFIVVLDIPQIAMLASIMYLILFMFVDASLIASRRRNKERRLGFRVPLVPLTPALGIAVNLALAAYLWEFPAIVPGSIGPGKVAWYVVILWVTIGMFYHFFAGGKKPMSRAEERARIDLSDILATGKTDIDLQRYRVFLPLREFSDTGLVRFGALVARERGGELSILNVVEIPRNLPPKAIRFSFVNDRLRELDRLTKLTRKEGVDTRASVKIGHKVHEIIVDTLGEEDVNLLVLGWRGGREAPGRILGSNIDYLVETAPCDVVVLKTKGLKEKLGRLLMIAGPSFSLEGVSDIALTVARNDAAGIRILVVGGHESEVKASADDAQPFVNACKSAGVSVELKAIVAKELEQEVRRESADCDIVLISSPHPRGTRRLMLSPTEQKLARMLDKPVLLYRKGTKLALAA